ncbi:hypothetical protein M9Y10_021805 [Tritrichomonas musculus]|uniref:NADP-dependent oxidoreductase domain-containing protein n=1 Tax=Tritrichomonas musculus TaxID=1915356 RepID=A0ABR2KRC7_9EUKA
MVNMDNLYTKEEADNKYALKTNFPEILKDEKIYDTDNEIFFNNIAEAAIDNNVLSSQLAIKFIWENNLEMLIEAAVLKDETTRSDRFNIEGYETQTLNDIDEEKDYEVLSEKSSMKMYYNLLDKIKAKQDKLNLISSKNKLVDIPFIKSNINNSGQTLIHESL